MKSSDVDSVIASNVGRGLNSKLFAKSKGIVSSMQNIDAVDNDDVIVTDSEYDDKEDGEDDMYEDNPMKRS